ncbi:glycosyltransferase family 9 protein [Luteipulveratus halotolerans]|uniref:Glycosyl transferase family 9 n=1 Tax=Luteipulveratus halotolerans TaxID=1631356 RepID=A0A0L6CPA3_9MICO|nr:glycosyltransferase family 9 protein [Luteipulveratus halotolerans]KNX39589.1 hypothetical protein VV01_18555 [Luteipulveratus halotolerans]
MRRRALVLRALGLGDALTAVAALRGLRRLLPEHEIVLAGPEDVGGWLADLRVVDRVLPIAGLSTALAWSGPAPEVAVNLHGRGPESHRRLQTLRPHRMIGFANGAAGFSCGPAWPGGLHEVDRWCFLMRSSGVACSPQDLRLPVRTRPSARPYVLIHPGASAAARRWPVHRWHAVVRAITRHTEVRVTGTWGERRLGRDVTQGLRGAHDLCGRLDVSGLAAQVAGATAVLSTDTGIAHLATALGTPSVTLFGPTSPVRWGPSIDTARHLVLWREDVPTLADPHAICIDPRLDAVGVPEVLQALGQVTRRPSSRAAVSS